jgi:CubicO group peptidase (beta-lactamase class C family)
VCQQRPPRPRVGTTLEMRHKYLTLVYQLNSGCRWLLHVSRGRSIRSLLEFFRMLKKAKVDYAKTIRFVCSDMWQAYLTVIAKKVLSHTAGFNVHGFGGYQFGHKIPTLFEVLNGAPPANSAAIVVESAPGAKFAYSGGGITVMQQAVIDVTHQPFDKAMQDLVLGPLDMKQSTYAQPLPAEWRARAAVGHEDGKPLAGKWHVYPEMAAAGLWTTPSDLARFVIALAKAGRGDSGAILPPALAKQMLIKQPGGWGLGIEVDGAGPTLRFSHNGVNAGFLSQLIGYVQRGQGVVVMVNSGGEGGSALMEEICQDAAIELGWD